MVEIRLNKGFPALPKKKKTKTKQKTINMAPKLVHTLISEALNLGWGELASLP